MSKALLTDVSAGITIIDLGCPKPLPGQLRVRALCSLISPGMESYHLDR